MLSWWTKRKLLLFINISSLVSKVVSLRSVQITTSNKIGPACYYRFHKDSLFDYVYHFLGWVVRKTSQTKPKINNMQNDSNLSKHRARKGKYLIATLMLHWALDTVAPPMCRNLISTKDIFGPLRSNLSRFRKT